ncbi:MAG: hypothetical protein ACKO57_01870, partial [Alphaproteobacteria bacterium]
MKIASFLVLFFVALVFSGCGFSPVYGSEANTTLPEVTLGQIEGKYAYLLDQSLRTRLRARGQSADAGDSGFYLIPCLRRASPWA